MLPVAGSLHTGNQHFIFFQAHVLGEGVGSQADDQNRQGDIEDNFILYNGVHHVHTSVSENHIRIFLKNWLSMVSLGRMS